MSKRTIALDLGTTNTGLSIWDSQRELPDLIRLPGISRQKSSFSDVTIDDAATIPSAVLIDQAPNWLSRLGSWPWIERTRFIGSRAKIGLEAANADAHQRQKNYRIGFKSELLDLCARGKVTQTAVYKTTQLYVRELLASATRTLGWRPNEIVFGTPVDCYESYRGALKQIAASLGMTARFVDEPVAAALGYGAQIQKDTHVLVIDFGAGTLDLVAMSINYESMKEGHAQVLGKWGEQLGGNDVDNWIAQFVCEQLGLPDPNVASDHLTNWWMKLVLEECCQIKERLFFQDPVPFSLEIPPSLIRRTARKKPREFSMARADLIGLLAAKQFYQRLDHAIDQVINASQRNHTLYEQVLLVGGSTLLPEVYSRVEQRFGRANIKAWQPFHAVTLGAAVFSSGSLPAQDQIFHDYAIRAWDMKTHQAQHQLVIRGGTKYPTLHNHWTGRFIPTCAHGEPEETFKLVICEIGRKLGTQNEVAWDADGQAHLLRHSDDRIVVALNEENPTLGDLNPPHWPSDKNPRLEIQFGIDEERWLIATVRDLRNKNLLLDRHPVLQLR